MTAGGPGGDRARCLAAGMNGYLTKPLFQDALMATLQRYLRQPGSSPVYGHPAATAEERPADQPLEPATLSALGESLGDEGLAALITLFRQQSEAHLAGLEQAVAEGAPRRVEYLAHQLKGEASSLGAVKVAGLAMRLERLGREERRDEMAPCLGSLHRCLAQTLTALEAWAPGE